MIYIAIYIYPGVTTTRLQFQIIAFKTPPANLHFLLNHRFLSNLRIVEPIGIMESEFRAVVDTVKEMDTYSLQDNLKILVTVELEVLMSQHIEQPFQDF